MQGTYPPPRPPVLVRHRWYLDAYVRSVLSVIAASTIAAAVIAITSPEDVLAHLMKDGTFHPPPLSRSELISLIGANYPTDPSLPAWQQFLEYLFTAFTWWPAVLVIVGGAVATVALEWRAHR